MTEATVEGFAATVHLSRRALGLSLDALAGRSGVPVAALRDLEAGGPASPADRASLCRALNVDPVTYVTGSPTGPVRVPEALDDGHRDDMAAFARVAAGRGWLLHPDVVARRRDATPVYGVAEARMQLATHVASEGRGVGRSLFAALVIVIEVAFFSLLSRLDGGSLAWSLGLLFPLALSATLSVWYMATDRERTERREATDAVASRRARERAEMVDRAYVVLDAGLEVLTMTAHGVAIREVPAGDILRVDVRDVSGTCVDVEVLTPRGPLTMPWVAKSPDLFTLLARWRDRRE